MLATLIVIVTFLLPWTEQPPVVVTHDAAGWTVTPNMGRAENCQYVIDAKRLIAGRPLTKGLPRRCMTAFDREQRPDPWPGRK